MLINSSIDGASACYFIYQPPTNSIGLINDAGTALAQLTPGRSGTLSNSHCKIPASSVSVTSSANSITVQLTVTFTHAFAGPKSIWATWFSNNVQLGGWQTLGSWTVQ
jgi:hypothetical protein